MGKNKRTREVNSRLHRTLFVLAMVWDFGVVALVGAKAEGVHANSKMPTRLAHAITVLLSTRGRKECKIPQELDDIIPSVHSNYFAPKQGWGGVTQMVRMFDPVHFYGWDLPGVGSPVLVTASDLCQGLSKALMEEKNMPGPRKQKLLGMLCSVEKVAGKKGGSRVIFVDTKEMGGLCLRKAGDTGCSFGEVGRIFDHWRDVDKCREVHGACRDTTPGMNRFGVSSRARPLKTTGWNRVPNLQGGRLIFLDKEARSVKGKHLMHMMGKVEEEIHASLGRARHSTAEFVKMVGVDNQ